MWLCTAVANCWCRSTQMSGWCWPIPRSGEGLLLLPRDLVPKRDVSLLNIVNTIWPVEQWQPQTWVLLIPEHSFMALFRGTCHQNFGSHLFDEMSWGLGYLCIHTMGYERKTVELKPEARKPEEGKAPQQGLEITALGFAANSGTHLLPGSKQPHCRGLWSPWWAGTGLVLLSGLARSCLSVMSLSLPTLITP